MTIFHAWGMTESYTTIAILARPQMMAANRGCAALISFSSRGDSGSAMQRRYFVLKRMPIAGQGQIKLRHRSSQKSQALVPHQLQEAASRLPFRRSGSLNGGQLCGWTSKL